MSLARVLCLATLYTGATVGNVARAGTDPYADVVVNFSLGVGGVAGFDNPGNALGEPSRFSGEFTPFPSIVSAFSPAFGTDELFSIGQGGHITLRFDEPIEDDANNPFGLDFIVFGNAGFIDFAFPFGQVGPTGAMFGVGAASLVEVSANGSTWFPVGGGVDALFPTMGYSDVLDPYSSVAGNVPTDFTLPVDPTFNPNGKTMAQLIAGYAGSGGGRGYDISSSGLSSVSYVRITNVSSVVAALEIDAVSDVRPIPTPATVPGGLLGFVITCGRRRRCG